MKEEINKMLNNIVGDDLAKPKYKEMNKILKINGVKYELLEPILQDASNL